MFPKAIWGPQWSHLGEELAIKQRIIEAGCLSGDSTVDDASG